MRYAEYYIKQNVVSLNDIEIDVLKKPFFNSLLINRNFLNFINIHVIIEKEKTKNVKRTNVHLYKIKIKLIYNNNNNDNNNNFDKSAYLKNALHQEKNSSVTQKYDYIESKSFNVKDKKREIYLNHNVNYKNDINIYNNNVNENIDNIERTNQYSKNYKMLYAQGVSSNASQYKNIKKCTSNLLTKSCDISDVLKKKNLFSQMFSTFENECFSKYIYLPSFISIRKANIKSIHFLLNNKLTIVLSLDLIVDKTNNNAFEINRNLELDNMLKLENNQIILCKTCNSNIINYSNVNSIMPHLYVNINNFFEHAFCEECTSFSYEGLNDTRNTIIIFPNYLSFNYGIINKCNLSIKKNNLENYRHLFFCTNCYTHIGYLEDNNKKNNLFGYNNNKSINENIKNNIFQSIQQNNPDDYINIDHSNLLNISNKLYLNNTNKENKTNIEHFNNNYINTLQKQKEKKIKENNIMMNNKISSNNMNIENDCKLNPNSETNHTNDNEKKDCHTQNCIQHNIIQKEGFINDDDINNNEQKTKEQCDPYDSIKFYIFKHKISIPLYKENIFKNYNDVLFLNEYIYNRNEKYNIQTFYITNNEKKYIIDIRIFIKQMYISSILQKIRNNENLIFFQKVIKILYSIKAKSEITCANAEVLNVSKGIYEDLLKILITYSYTSKIFKNKFVSYLPLVQ
ncbi:conserved Plasmodium protein, unknown function [Plasmodium sp. gorilla clade G2]|uniref:conserved Plasmodium protein, unknown function n=1 Tax=Plasmodium sp. gorilla clade G2 TaxID=880535 RepID=UPI000D21BB13|nr:conserved Plasmodium protein, unknown function [Plasmodium sp. gorilla clade G2]SOV19880.1 conserved Plasmodium protein, unknown function [Plasmodium sp. gorilla clade G2]